MVKIIVTISFVAILAMLPVLALQAMVVPQLNNMADAYGQAAERAQQIADPAVDENATKLR